MTATQLRRACRLLFNYLLAPGACYACGVAINTAATLCDTCAARLERVPAPCAACGQPEPTAAAICARCRLQPPRWQQLIAPFQYRGLMRHYLLQLKFNDAQYLSRTLCEQALPAFASLPVKPEVLIPVPLHRSRLLERGYNQAGEIASVWSGLLGIPVDRRCLGRHRATASQSGLSAAQRRNNLRNAFVYRPGRDYRHVAVVDDIVTTGTTADEITRLLHRSGVETVEVWALARAYRR